MRASSDRRCRWFPPRGCCGISGRGSGNPKAPGRDLGHRGRGCSLCDPDVVKVNIDTTVSEKANAFVTDARFYPKTRVCRVCETKQHGIRLGQSFHFVSKRTPAPRRPLCPWPADKVGAAGDPPAQDLVSHGTPGRETHRLETYCDQNYQNHGYPGDTMVHVVGVLFQVPLFSFKTSLSN